MIWNLRRVLISAFVIAHLCAVTIWIVPFCALKQRFVLYLAYYMLPLGQWQYWGMFAPNPMVQSVTLEASVADARGLMHRFEFPKEASLSRWEAGLRFRHSKYASNFSLKDEFKAHREFAARHVLRQLRLPAEAFPVDVQLYYQVWNTPPPGTRLDPLAQPTISQIDTYRFPSMREALP